MSISKCTCSSAPSPCSMTLAVDSALAANQRAHPMLSSNTDRRGYSKCATCSFRQKDNTERGTSTFTWNN